MQTVAKSFRLYLHPIQCALLPVYVFLPYILTGSFGIFRNIWGQIFISYFYRQSIFTVPYLHKVCNIMFN